MNENQVQIQAPEDEEVVELSQDMLQEVAGGTAIILTN